MDTVSMDVVRKVLSPEILGEGIHTALRKYCEYGMEAHKAISRMPDNDWHLALEGVSEDLIDLIERGIGGRS